MEQAKEFREKVKIVVELDSSLGRFVTPEGDEAQAFRRHLLQYLDDLLADLTIPTNISLTVTHGEDVSRFTMTSYQVAINDQRCRLPLPARVPQDVEALELARSVAKGVCQNPELFISVSLAERIQERRSSENGEEYLTSTSPDKFHEFLVDLVRRYFKIDRAREFAKVLREKVPREWNAKKSFEEVVSGWSAVTLGVFIPQRSALGSVEDTKTQSTTDDKQIEKTFDMMRDGLWYELGVVVPKVRIDIDKSLEEDEFRIQLNDLRLPPIRGLKQGYFLVNDTVDRLSLIKISGKIAINPANESECAIVRDENGAKKICQDAGLTTWDPEEFAILSVAATIRRNGDAFLTTDAVRYSVNQLRMAFPALLDTTLERFDIAELTGILRDLLEEEFSIRNLRGILEALLAIHASAPRAQQLVEHPRRYAETQVDRSSIAQSLRIAFKRYISNKYAKGGKNLVVYLLDPEIEMRIMNIDKQPLRPRDEDHDQLIKAIFNELGDVPTATRNAVILTTLEVRRRLRNLIEKEFPGLAVLCYQELSPDLNIQPLGRISWS